jgi:hypothetical protein
MKITPAVLRGTPATHCANGREVRTMLTVVESCGPLYLTKAPKAAWKRLKLSRRFQLTTECGLKIAESDDLDMLRDLAVDVIGRMPADFPWGASVAALLTAKNAVDLAARKPIAERISTLTVAGILAS